MHPIGTVNLRSIIAVTHANHAFVRAIVWKQGLGAWEVTASDGTWLYKPNGVGGFNRVSGKEGQ